MIARFAQWQQKSPQSIAADASYGNGELLQSCIVCPISLHNRNAVVDEGAEEVVSKNWEDDSAGGNIERTS
jgi:hypothetical protein